MRLIEVEYEVLPALMSIDEALAHSEVKINDEARTGNIHKAVSYEFGDMEAGFDAADYVREDWLYYEGNNHAPLEAHADRKSTRLNSSHRCISYAVFCLKKKKCATGSCGS